MPPTSLAGYAADIRAEVAVTSVCAAAGAYGGAAASELIGCDVAVSCIGPVAEPLGQYLGRSTGIIIGGALGAGAIRRSSRSGTRSRSISQVRFAPDVPIAMSQAITGRNSSSTRLALSQVAAETLRDPGENLRRATSPDLIVAVRAGSAANMPQIAQRNT